MIDQLRWDLRYAVKQLVRNPGFTLAAGLTLALGIGANTLVFSFVNGMLLRPLPVAQPEGVVGLFATDRRSGTTQPLSYPEYLDYRDRSGIFSGLAAQQGTPLSLAVGDRAEMVWGEIVTENYFSVLGLRPALGRAFRSEDAAGSGSDPIVVLSHRLWQERFGGDRRVLGSVIRLNGQALTIVGVAPEGFRGVRRFGFWPEVWVPMMMHAQVMRGSAGLLHDRQRAWLTVSGRIRSGLPPAAATEAAREFAARLEAAYPETNDGRGARLVAGRSGFDNPDFFPPQTLVLSAALAMGAVGLVLLLACSNVAGLLVARAAARTREVGVRVALGASRARLLRQFLTESVLLALVGGTLSTLLALWSGEIEALLVPQLQFQVGFESSLDHRVLGFSLAASLLTALLFGLAPGLHATKSDVVSLLRTEGQAAHPFRRRIDIRSLLVIFQVALTLVLLIGGGLFLKSLVNARSLDIGFAREDRLILTLDPGLQGYDSARSDRFYRALVQRVREVPGVASATLSFPLPLDSYTRIRTAVLERESGLDDTVDVGVIVAGPDYFGTVGTALLRGRDFRPGDSAGTQPVVVINQTLAARLGAGQEPTGRFLRILEAERDRLQIIGVARDGRYGTLGESPQPYVYLPLAQHHRSWLTLVVRTREDPAALIPRVRDVVHRLDPDLAPFGVMTMRRHVENALNLATSSAVLAGAFGGLALLLAVVGIYGVVSYSVTRRTREMGIRIALGAASHDVLRLMLGQGLALAASGLALGLAVALGASRLIEGMLYDVSPRDPEIFTSLSLALGAVVLLATYLPARRATRVDPVVALRSE